MLRFYVVLDGFNTHHRWFDTHHRGANRWKTPIGGQMKASGGRFPHPFPQFL
jgi:hypothetical protein